MSMSTFCVCRKPKYTLHCPTLHQLLTSCLYFCTSQIPSLHSILVSGQETQLRHKITYTTTSKKAEYAQLSGFCSVVGIVLSLGTEFARFTFISSIEQTIRTITPFHKIFILRKIYFFLSKRRT